MSKLSTTERDALPATSFVFPKERSFPIPDENHARFALDMAHNESPERAAKVRAEVKRRYPKIDAGSAGGMSPNDAPSKGAM